MKDLCQLLLSADLITNIKEINNATPEDSNPLFF